MTSKDSTTTQTLIMNNQFLSCKCITYARVNFLEEAIQSFLQQDYPADKCELVIVNDYPLQTLVFDHPQVRIFNLKETFKTIGEKENFAAEQCKGDTIAHWDDDDIALPNHLQNVNKYFVEGTVILQWHRGVFFNDMAITSISGIGNAGYVYSKKAWEESGRYQKENAGHDMSFVMHLRTLYPDKFVSAAPADDEVSFMYMWGGRGYHASGQGTDTPDRPNIIQRHSAYIEYERVKGRIPTGIIQLRPHWEDNYTNLLKQYVEKNKGIRS